MVKKAAELSSSLARNLPKQSPLFFLTQFQMQSFVLDISKLCRQYGYSLFFVVKYFQNHCHGICSNFAIMEATK